MNAGPGKSQQLGSPIITVLPLPGPLPNPFGSELLCLLNGVYRELHHHHHRHRELLNKTHTRFSPLFPRKIRVDRSLRTSGPETGLINWLDFGSGPH